MADVCADPGFSAPVSSAATEGRRVIVLDTNIILDVFVFSDPATVPLLAGLRGGSLHWIATQPMRDELERVLAYPKIVKRLTYYQLQAADVLAPFDTLVHLKAVPAKAPITCKDPDDQKFIDLAVAHRSIVLSKDNAVLCMQKRLLALGSIAQVAIENVA